MAFFNPIRPSYVDDPYPSLARLRTEDPVYFSRELGAWIVTRYEDCSFALRDEATFSSDFSGVHSAWWDQTRARHRSLIGSGEPLSKTDPPDHNRMRELVAGAFTPRTVEAFRPYIKLVVQRLLDAVPSEVSFDFMEQLARPLPRLVIAEQLGIAESDREEFMANTYAVMRGVFSMNQPADAQAATAARMWLRDYLARARAESMGHEGGDTLARMFEGNREGRLSDDELLALAIDVAMAGNDATGNLLGNWMLALLQHPAELQRLRDQPATIAEAIDEFIRFDSPVQAVPRVVTKDVTLGRQQLKAGALLYLMLGAADRDPAQFAQPDRIDPERGDRRHLGFGAGIHYCLGAPLARLEAEIAITALLGRFPTLRLAPRGVERDAAFDKRGPTRLMVIAQ